MGAQRELRGHGERRGAAGLGDTHGAALRSGEVEQLQLGVALQGPLQVPQLPVHPRHHRRAEPAGTARGVGRRRGRPKRGEGGVPGRTPTARPRGAGCCAAPGREGRGPRAARCGWGSPPRGRFHGRPRPAARGPLSAARRAAAVRRSGAEGEEKGEGGRTANGEEGDGGGGSAHPVPPLGDPQQQQPPPAQRRGHGGARTAPSGAGRTLRPSPGRSSAVAASG